MRKPELLNARPKDRNDYFEVLVTYNESSSSSTSRLAINVVPLIHYNTINGKVFVSDAPHDHQVYEFDLQLDHSNRTAQFATQRDVISPPCLQGAGVASYAFVQLIEWGKKIAPTYKVLDLKLGYGDAQNESAKQLRNEFYKSLGFELNFDFDPEHRTGHCSAKSLDQLGKKINGEKIINRCDAQDRLCELIKGHNMLEGKLDELDFRLAARSEQVAQLSRFKTKVYFWLSMTAIGLGCGIYLKYWL